MSEQISIPFTRDEWMCIKGSLEYNIHYGETYPDECEDERNIIDRIEKNLRIE